MSILHLVFGRMTFETLPFWEMMHYPTRQNIVNGAIATTAAAIVLGGVAATALLITRYRKWRLVWRDWLTSVDHKRIGIMYVVIALVMLARGLIEANIMRAQMAFGLGGGFLPADHFEQFFTTHGTIMIFCMAMPFLTGAHQRRHAAADRRARRRLPHRLPRRLTAARNAPTRSALGLAARARCATPQRRAV
jgi:cytochrome o ubiquinol oxidase subunit I